MPEERSKETVARLKKAIQERRGGYRKEWNPRFNPQYDEAYLKAKKMIAEGVPKIRAYTLAGIHPDAFRRRKRWEESCTNQNQ